MNILLTHNPSGKGIFTPIGRGTWPWFILFRMAEERHQYNARRTRNGQILELQQVSRVSGILLKENVNDLYEDRVELRATGLSYLRSKAT